MSLIMCFTLMFRKIHGKGLPAPAIRFLGMFFSYTFNTCFELVGRGDRLVCRLHGRDCHYTGVSY